MLHLLLQTGATKSGEAAVSLCNFVSFYCVDVRRGTRQREGEK